MAHSIPYWHVDAFSARPFGGNQAAVMVLDEWLDDEQLQAIGEENNFAETAFVVRDQTGQADWELRWFTPTDEVALCGHATLASGHAILERDGGERVTFRTRKAGILEVRRKGDAYELALPLTRVRPAQMPDLVAALGAQGECFLSYEGAEQTAIVLYESEEDIGSLEPDLAALAKIDLMAICTTRGTDHDVVSRVFVPAWGVPEDSVTGSAHAALAPFWAEHIGKNEMTAHQASRRGGDLTMRLDHDRVWLGGPCVTVVEGVFRL